MKTCLDSGRARLVMRDVAAQCVHVATGAVNMDTPASWNGKGKVRSNKGPLGRDPPAALAMCCPR